MRFDIVLNDEIARRFFNKVEIQWPCGCWLWKGWKNHSGHARFDIADQKVLATHIALKLDGRPRPPPPNDFALHGDTCVDATCVNPRHLRWGTAQENTADRDRLGRRLPPQGVTNGNSKLTDADVRYIRRSDKSQRALARELGVSQPLIGNVRRGETWKHVE